MSKTKKDMRGRDSKDATSKQDKTNTHKDTTKPLKTPEARALLKADSKVKETAKIKEATPIAQNPAPIVNQSATLRPAESKVADDEEINGILTASVNQTYQTGATATEFVECSIIAERVPEPVNGKYMAPEYLVEGLPVWRRSTGHNGADKEHVKKWNALKKEKPKHVMQVEKENGDYTSVVVHAMHPRFEDWTLAKKTFKEGVTALDAEAKAVKREKPKEESKAAMMEVVANKQEADKRDKVEALKMLNILLEHLFEDMEAGDGVLGRLRESLFEQSYGDEWPNMARTFYEFLALASRRELAEGLLHDPNASTFGTMTTTLCIVLIPERTVLKAWADRGITDGPSKYTTTVAKFLEEYHNENHSSESLIYTRHIFSTLSKLMQVEGGGIMLLPAAPNRAKSHAAETEECGREVAREPVLKQDVPPSDESDSDSGEDEIHATAPHKAPAAKIIEISSSEDDSDIYIDSNEDSNISDSEAESEAEPESELETEQDRFAKVVTSANEVFKAGGPPKSKQIVTRGRKRKANAEISRHERKARRGEWIGDRRES